MSSKSNGRFFIYSDSTFQYEQLVLSYIKQCAPNNSIQEASLDPLLIASVHKRCCDELTILTD